MVMFGGIAVAMPPGAFLQATAAAEQAMAELVGAHLSRAKKVADLFAGCGTFALRLAREIRGPCGRRRRGGACGIRPGLSLMPPG